MGYVDALSTVAGKAGQAVEPVQHLMVTMIAPAVGVATQKITEFGQVAAPAFGMVEETVSQVTDAFEDGVRRAAQQRQQ